VDNRTERSESDTAGDEQQIFSGEHGVDREAVAVRTAYRYLLSDFHRMQPFGDAAALLYREFHELYVCRRRGYRKHSLAAAGNRQHRALSGNMLERLFAVGSDGSEGLDVRRVDAYIGDNADCRHKRFFNISH